MLTLRVTLENLGQRTKITGRVFKTFISPACGTSKGSHNPPGACKVFVEKLGGLNGKTRKYLRVHEYGRGFAIDAPSTESHTL